MATKLRDYHIQEAEFEGKEDDLLLLLVRFGHTYINKKLASDIPDILASATQLLVTFNATRETKRDIIMRLFLILQSIEPANTIIPSEIDIALEPIYDIKMKNKYLKYKSKYLNLSRKNTV